MNLKGEFKRRDYRAAERILQVFTELCIGLSKHWLKAIKSETSTDAYKSFRLLKENNQISSETLIHWKKIIDLRNGLVHDYLNIDPLIVENVIRKEHYKQLVDFCDMAIAKLYESE